MHRPRLFQTFSRSKEQRASPDSGYDERDYGYYNQYEHKDERASAWRKVLSRKPREESNRPAWEEEVVEYPSRAASYAPDAYSANSQRYARDPYAGEHTDSRAYMEDRYENDRSSFSDPVPIVQRENSLTRMRDMFTDPNRASHAVTDIPLPANTNRYTVADSQSPVEVHNTHPSRHQPVIINNTTTHSVRPDMDYTHELSERARGKRPDYRSRRDSSPDSYDRLSNENEYPPCVVVVERGRHGKPDKYYIIPGGAPVIFEDEHGKELTRVGDFSGRYRPQKPTRPVIIEDEYGREMDFTQEVDVETTMIITGMIIANGAILAATHDTSPQGDTMIVTRARAAVLREYMRLTSMHILAVVLQAHTLPTSTHLLVVNRPECTGRKNTAAPVVHPGLMVLKNIAAPAAHPGSMVLKNIAAPVTVHQEHMGMKNTRNTATIEILLAGPKEHPGLHPPRSYTLTHRWKMTADQDLVVEVQVMLLIRRLGGMDDATTKNEHLTLQITMLAAFMLMRPLDLCILLGKFSWAYFFKPIVLIVAYQPQPHWICLLN
ncbi:hypothetical protein EUX98_g431 [Antrodiella citrinella]|uniref:Uncharacterized protein n=1 Tax=Antrodiella citrinella TaxID=2447956 RepID=A0A4S4N3W5_9APHY|nr:hypothetical protein EUX98_g431 [Antrodiella citrinella]